MATATKTTSDAAREARDRLARKRQSKTMLISIYAKHRVNLVPSLMGRNAYGQEHVARAGRTLKFEGYHCEINPDEMIPIYNALGEQIEEKNIVDLIEDNPAYTGRTAGCPKAIAWAGEPLVPFNRQAPLQTVLGAMVAGPKVEPPPLGEWDSMTPSEITDAINEGQVGSLQKAMNWEMNHRRRPAVMILLAEGFGSKFVGAEQPETEDSVQFVAATPETFGPPPAEDK